MNIFKLLALLIKSDKETISRMSESPYIDYIAIFKSLYNSPNLCEHVLNEFEKEILPKTKKILKGNNNLINVIIEKNSFKIDFNGETRETNENPCSPFVSKFEIVSFFKRNKISKNTVFRFELKEDGKRTDLIKNIRNKYIEIKESIADDLLICEVNKDEMLKDYNKNGYQYFFSYNDKNYCIWFRDFYEFNHYTDDLALFLMSKINKLKKIKPQKIKTEYEFNGNDQTSYSWEEYIKYALKKLYVEGCFSHDFFKKESNYFFRCFNVLKKTEGFLTICKKFIMQADCETQKQFFYFF